MGEKTQDVYDRVRAAIGRGDFDESRSGLESLGFVFKGSGDHFTYHHPELKQDPIFRYPRNLYRPHGKKRDCDRICQRDQSCARQMVEALRAVRGLKTED